MGYSFIVPVFNCRETLVSCVESIRGAALSEYEILLIDDGSTDGSGILCDRLGAAYPEIRVFHQKNAGVSVARNLGLRDSGMDRLLFVDADDWVDGIALRQVLREEGDMVIFGAEGGFCDPKPGNVNWREDFAHLFWENAFSPVWNKVYNTRILKEYSLEFREELFLYEDLEFVLRYLAHCERVVNVPLVAYRHRPSDKASQRVQRLERISDVLLPLSQALEALALPEETTEAVKLGLFQILAREKIAVSNLAEIRKICEDYRKWHKKSGEESDFMRKLRKGKVLSLWISSRMIALRHGLGRWKL